MAALYAVQPCGGNMWKSPGIGECLLAEPQSVGKIYPVQQEKHASGFFDAYDFCCRYSHCAA